MEKLGEFIRGRGLAEKHIQNLDMQVPDGFNSIQLEKWFIERLYRIIPPRNISDRTSFRRVAIWLLRKLESKEADAQILVKVLRYAQEAAGPDSRKPAAVFMSILKKEMGYCWGR